MKKILLLATILTVAYSSLFAQYCNPPTANTAIFWIDGVQLNMINNQNTGAGTNGYQDFTGQVDTLVEGSSYTLTVDLNQGNTVYFDAWIDYNNDSSFSITEKIMTDYRSLTSSATFMVPAGVNANATRMRIITSLFNSTTNPCVTSISYGETEDYNIFIKANTSPPKVAMNVDAEEVSICNMQVNFTDGSSGIPTSWRWDFGDGNTDTVQNPTHTYAAVGTYNVKLVASNTFGSDSTTNLGFVTVKGSHAVPYVQNFESGQSALNDFIIQTNTESTLETAALAGYNSNTGMAMGGVTWQNWVTPSNGQEFVTNPLHNASASICIDATGVSDLVLLYDLRVLYQFSTTYNYFRVLVDGQQVGITHKPLTQQNMPWKTIDLDLSAYAGTSFELTFESSARYAYDYNGAHRGNGFYVDNIRLLEPTDPPTVEFTADETTACAGTMTVNFTDKSSYLITAWFWDFGDGNTSTVENPTHTYTSSGTFDVSLTATNKNGNVTLKKDSLITITSQGPIAPSCKPLTQNTGLDAGIFNVSIENIYNTTNGNKDSYKDYSCTKTTTLIEGTKVNVSIRTAQNFDENVRVWIDYNNDGFFDENTETVFRSDTSRTMHTGKFKVPGWAEKDTMLRMRVAADYYFYPMPTPCGDPTYGQVEDYGVMILENTKPPFAAFSSDLTVGCIGAVQFFDQTTNVAKAWLWNFGDGNLSTDQNPVHTYTAPGSYMVSLKVTNDYGADSTTVIDYVEIVNGPDSAFCYPQTISATSNLGIFGVELHTIKNYTQDANTEGYVDFACQGKQTELIEDLVYPLSVLTGTTINENVRVWIDWDNNTFFDEITELVFASDNGFIYHSTTFQVPLGATMNEALRMRVASAAISEPFPTPCDDIMDGQVEDYIVTVVDNQRPPVPLFNTVLLDACVGEAQFLDLSFNDAQSWFWDFGDGTTSTDQNPKHLYSQPGFYNVMLAATNSFGSDTLIKKVEINFTTADFEVDKNPASPGDAIQFTNLSNAALSYQWDFGDGTVSSDADPSHIYFTTGVFKVKLAAVGAGNCSVISSEDIYINIDGVNELDADKFTIYPNPSTGVVHFQFGSVNEDLHFELINIYGQLVKAGNMNPATTSTLELNDLAKGIYFIRIFNNETEMHSKLELH